MCHIFYKIGALLALLALVLGVASVPVKNNLNEYGDIDKASVIRFKRTPWKMSSSVNGVTRVTSGGPGGGSTNQVHSGGGFGGNSGPGGFRGNSHSGIPNVNSNAQRNSGDVSVNAVSMQGGNTNAHSVAYGQGADSTSFAQSGRAFGRGKGRRGGK